ncbi:hypothetical protein lerEdw1_014730 [Lerista edwardsae]|nr:hypothetical protein lerEdw1_014733 [Lerista edwardsae]KAJ6628038.1 hypothetical protein lerEdw1_014730 [Lerista edwardsae]
MSMLLVSGLWMLLCLSFGDALWCNKCKRPGTQRLCLETEEFCWVDGQGGCYTENIFVRRKLIRNEAGCSTPCTDFTEPRSSTKWIQYYCCSEDYCN